MLKHERAALRRNVEAIYVDAEKLYAIVKSIVATGPYGIPPSHHVHIADIVGELLRVAPALSGDVALLSQLQEPAAARVAVTEALAALHNADPRIFQKAPSPRLLALQLCGENADNSSWCSAVSSADYAHADDRRRRWLALARQADELGEIVYEESDLLPRHLARDDAIAQAALTGGGLRPSRIS